MMLFHRRATVLALAALALAAPRARAQPTDPFAFADLGWLNGNSRETEYPLDGEVFSGQFSLDGN